MRHSLLSALLVALAAAPLAAARAPAEDSVLLVLHSTQPKITVLDSERGRRLKTIKLEREAADLEIAADGTHLYLSNKDEARVTVIDLTGKDAERSIELGGSGVARGLAMAGSDLVVALSGTGDVVLVDVDKGEVKKRVQVSERSLDRVAVYGNYAYVSDLTSGNVAVVDLDRGSVPYTVRTGATAGAITFDPASSSVWVADRLMGEVRLVAAKDSQVVQTLACPGGPTRVVLAGGRVFALCADAADIAVVASGARTIDRRIAIRTEFGGTGSMLNRMVIDPGGTRAYLGGGDDRRILVLDLEGLEIVDRFDVDAPVAELLCVKKFASVGRKSLKREKLKKGDPAESEKPPEKPKEDGEKKDDPKYGGG